MRIRDEWRQKVTPKAFYGMVAGVTVALCLFGAYTMRFGYASLDSPVFYGASLGASAVGLLFFFIRYGIRALRLPPALIQMGVGLMMANHLLDKAHPYRGWMDGTGWLISMVGIAMLLGTFKSPRTPAPDA